MLRCHDEVFARVSQPDGFAREGNFSGERTPRLDQAGWLRAQEISRSFLSARRRGGRSNPKANSLLNLVDRPVRSYPGGFAAFSLVASTPPDPGGELAPLRMDFLCKAPGGASASPYVTIVMKEEFSS